MQESKSKCISFRVALLHQADLWKIYGIFSDILLILIGLEMLHTVKVYLEDHTMHVEVILAVALLALARKVITINTNDQGTAIGLAVLIVALARR